jgi:hypothetical protein
MGLTSTGVDGIDVPGYGWTNQQYTSLESYSGPSSELFNAAVGNGYLAWSGLPNDFNTAVAWPVASTHGLLTRVFVPTNCSVGHADFYFPATGTPTVFDVSLFTSAGVQLAAAADAHSSVVNTALTPVAFTASATLTGGTFVYVFSTLTYTGSPTIAGWTAVAGGTGGAIAYANANLTVATAPDTADYGVQATNPSSLTLTGLTGLASKIWVGLRA